jgi:hypothetical protein
MAATAEHRRLTDYRNRTANWKHWGPYLSDRAWGTVREDYSAGGDAWDYFTHDQARSRAYRWNEDGLAGICDRNQYLCFALALWNGHDPILKERLFGLAGSEGNHGEDVKEEYFYLDSTPTHSYMQMLYKYPQAAYPYTDLLRENRRRGFGNPEYELIDTGVFDGSRYFDVFVEYAKAEPNDILIRISVVNRATAAADCHILPTLWFRNTWSWGYPAGPMHDVPAKPMMRRSADGQGISADHAALGAYTLYVEGTPTLLFTENDTNNERLFHAANPSPYVKDAFHRCIINGDGGAVNPAGAGTKAAAHYTARIGAGETWTVRLRLTNVQLEAPFSTYDTLFQRRRDEADEFYRAVQPAALNNDERQVQRQAFAGLLWTKQLFYFDVEQWLNGDPGTPPPPAARRNGRNRDWEHLNNFDVISMPDKWEYPWYAGWDLAFHCLPLALIDADFAKRQLELMTREWYMHPNGQFPAYEWSFSDVNPPVHAWAVWRVYKIDAKETGQPDREFLEAMYHKLLLNFTWWVNRKDPEGRSIFQGGFLGMDNISVFDRSAPLPTGGHLDQSDGTAWMGFYSLGMMKIALELALYNPVYQDTATKFFEHFLRIARAATNIGESGFSLWDEQDGFFYDALHLPDDRIMPLKVRSLVGLMTLLAVETLEPEMLACVPDFDRRVHWFLRHRAHLSGNVTTLDVMGVGKRRMVSFLDRDRLIRVLRYMLDEHEFLSPHGIRSISRVHAAQPYTFRVDGQVFTVRYQPAESENGLFGGNSNWRGPVWFPINYLLIEALQKFHHYYGDNLKVECPTSSGVYMTLGEVAAELSHRLVRLFLRDERGHRPIYGGTDIRQHDPDWSDYILFHEYFNGDNGAGVGATHQTGWTALVAKLIQQMGMHGAK